ncbi:hypothetical protein K2173_003656 [Erythroxylum novogranatense]|uniref:Uncharacterized protein n=1 Tax=Erythroxylum novogranatense TaxID=1862640 RepID=A0AAV8TCY8_9ROSI|nr:hypothetical protein K2173_003656 [Erythroxylum novogranatense]
MASDGREERRRRIMERGSDRIALITGQIRTLDASSPPPSSTHSHDQTTTEFYPSKNDRSLKSGIADDDDSGSKLVKDNGDNLDNVNQIETHSSSNVTNANTISDSPVSNMMKNIQASSSSEAHNRHKKIFCSKHINSCIIASEKTRATCSLTLALIVLVSYLDDSLLGINILSSESMIVSRPIYILLLTDATIVVGRMFVERASNASKGDVPDDGGMLKKEDPNNWTDAVKLLERGLVVYQAARGIFIDCSIYLVVVICGLSLI